MDADWTTTALFSPSKARVQQAQAKDWAAVDSWLAKKYGPRLPTFERNEATLQALLQLASLNETADEQRSQVERIEKAALHGLTKRPGGISDDVLPPLLSELANETHVDTLAEILVTVDAPNADVVRAGHRIVDLTSSNFERSQQLKRTEAQLDALRTEQNRVKSLLEELRSDDFRAPEDIAEHTTEWTRSTKQLKAKIAEYDERLASSRPATATAGLDAVQRKADEVSNYRVRLASLEAELHAFRDLPADACSARNVIEEARDRLRDLTSRRNKLFESLAET
ncbi:Hypothetical predicted protein [Lecanosticta acicola]|uniref:HAUS augmin-like complex subunit 1 n=1 Tax=Lecanosticta acicola TaxID=111012 RepID=A0AAI8YWV1_9PEZI|nr:Hypothetical predicted protein [Lecanosticta acicola]